MRSTTLLAVVMTAMLFGCTGPFGGPTGPTTWADGQGNNPLGFSVKTTGDSFEEFPPEFAQYLDGAEIRVRFGTFYDKRVGTYQAGEPFAFADTVKVARGWPIDFSVSLEVGPDDAGIEVGPLVATLNGDRPRKFVTDPAGQVWSRFWLLPSGIEWIGDHDAAEFTVVELRSEDETSLDCEFPIAGEGAAFWVASQDREMPSKIQSGRPTAWITQGVGELWVRPHAPDWWTGHHVGFNVRVASQAPEDRTEATFVAEDPERFGDILANVAVVLHDRITIPGDANACDSVEID